MAIQFYCACGKVLKAKDDAAGKRAKCAHCGQAVVVPQAGEPAVQMHPLSSTQQQATAVGVASASIPAAASAPLPATQPEEPPDAEAVDDVPSDSAAVAEDPTHPPSPPSRWQVAAAEARRLMADLGAYRQAGKDWLAASGPVDTAIALRTFRPPAPADGGSISGPADFALACAGCGQPTDAAPRTTELQVRDCGSLLVQALLSLGVAVVLWWALHDLFTSKPPRTPPHSLTWFNQAVLYGIPSTALLALLLIGLRRHPPQRVEIRYLDCGKHEPAGKSFRASLCFGQLVASQASQPQPVTSNGDPANAITRLLPTLLAIQQHRDYEEAEIPTAPQVCGPALLKQGLAIAAALGLAMLLFAPSDVFQGKWLAFFWTAALACVLGLAFWLEVLGRQRALAGIQQAARQARAWLLRRGFPTDAPSALDAVYNDLRSADFTALEQTGRAAEHPSWRHAALAAYAELVFNRTAMNDTETSELDGATRKAAATVFIDRIPEDWLPRLAYLTDELPHLAESPHVPARRGTVMIVRRLAPLLPNAIAIFASMLDDADEQAKAMAAKELAFLGDVAHDHLPRLLDLALSPAKSAQSLTLPDLLKVEPDAQRVARLLIDHLNNAHASRRPRIISFLGELGAAAADAVLPLSRLWADEDPQIRKQATAASKSIIHAARQAQSAELQVVPMLVEVLTDDHPARRVAAAQLLGGLGSEAKPAVPSLTSCSTHGYPAVRKAALEALAHVDPAAGLAARTALPARISASDQRVVQLRVLLKNYKPPDELARIRNDMEIRDKKIRELSKEKNLPLRKSPGNITGNALAFGLSALATGLNPAQMLITGATYGLTSNHANAKAHQERTEKLTDEISQLTELQERDQAQVDQVLKLYHCGLPIDSPAAIRSIGPLLEAETSADLLAASQAPDDSQRLVATLLLGEEIAPLDERLSALSKLLAEDPLLAVRQRAAISLGCIGDDSTAAAEALIRALTRDPDALVRRWAAATLALFPKHAVLVAPALRDALEDAAEEVRTQAAETLNALNAKTIRQP